MPSRLGSLEIENAILRVGERLGMKVLLLRMIAAELPDNPWLSGLVIQPEDAGVAATATHLCGSLCDARDCVCLTAYKIENRVLKESGKELGITHITLHADGRLTVHFRPFESPTAPHARLPASS